MGTLLRKKYSRKPRLLRRKRVARKPVSKKLKTYIKKVMHSNIENKHFFSYAANTAIVTASSSTPTALNLLPSLAIGASDGQRVGNQIKIVKGVVTFHCNILPYSATLNPLSTPIMVRCWILSGRALNSNSFAAYSPGTNFFEAGATQIGPQGTMLDMVLRNNTQEYIVHAQRTFKIGAAYASGTGPVGTGGYFDNSPMTKRLSFNWGKFVKSKLIYNDAVTNIPTNRNMFLVFQAVNADGSSSAVNPAEFHYTNEVLYEDA